MRDLAQEIYDVGLAAKLAAVTGQPADQWDGAIAAWRYAGWDPEALLEGVMLGGTIDAGSARKAAEESFAYAVRKSGEAFRQLFETVRPRWLARLILKLSH